MTITQTYCSVFPKLLGMAELKKPKLFEAAWLSFFP